MENQVEFKAEKSVLCWPDEKIRVRRQSDIKQWNYAKLKDDRERISYGKLSEKLDACDNLVMVHVILTAEERAQGRCEEQHWFMLDCFSPLYTARWRFNLANK